MSDQYEVLDAGLNSLVIGLWTGLPFEAFGTHSRSWNEHMLSGAVGLTSGFATHAMGRRPDSPNPVVIEGGSTPVTMLMATILNNAPEAHWEILHSLTDEQIATSIVEVIDIAGQLAWRALGPEKLPTLIGHLCSKVPGTPEGGAEMAAQAIVARWSK